ncbi:carboxypeptidase-like regulatory domain-containing protein [Mucilaginibacter sp.]
MKFIYLAFFIFNISVVNAQQIHLQGTIKDAETNQPIAAATISIQSKELYYPADNAGRFNIETDSPVNSDSVIFSCIGYKTKKVKAADLSPGIIVKLELNINVLQEVKINSKPIIPINVGSKYKYGKYSIPLKPGFDQAYFMDGSKNVKGIIQSVGFYLGNGIGIIKGGDITTPFRIRIFAVDTNGTPGRELTKDIIVVHGEKNNAWFDADLSAYHIPNPDSGFYASFTLLTDEYYQINKSIRTADSLYSPNNVGNAAEIITPRLGMMKGGKIPQRSYFSTEKGFPITHRAWQKDYFNFSYLIRATIIPEY